MAVEANRPPRVEVPDANALSLAVVDQIARRAHLITQRGLTGLSIQLEPKELGKVHVQISVSSEGLTVRMAAEANDSRDVIQSSLPYLKTALENQGLTVDRFDVGIGLGFSSFGSAQDNDHGQLFGSPNTAGQRLSNDDGAARSEPAIPSGHDSLVDYRI